MGQIRPKDPLPFLPLQAYLIWWLLQSETHNVWNGSQSGHRTWYSQPTPAGPRPALRAVLVGTMCSADPKLARAGAVCSTVLELLGLAESSNCVKCSCCSRWTVLHVASIPATCSTSLSSCRGGSSLWTGSTPFIQLVGPEECDTPDLNYIYVLRPNRMYELAAIGRTDSIALPSINILCLGKFFLKKP